MLKRAKGNLIKMAENGDFNIIVHGCNCFNNMGGGIARQIAEKYPQAERADNRCTLYETSKLGNYSEAEASDRSTWEGEDSASRAKAHWFKIINAYTQYQPGSGTFSYAALMVVFEKLIIEYPTAKFGLPYIGCGIAGGDQEIIIDIMEDFAKNIAAAGGSVTLVEYGE